MWVHHTLWISVPSITIHHDPDIISMHSIDLNSQKKKEKEKEIRKGYDSNLNYIGHHKTYSHALQFSLLQMGSFMILNLMISGMCM